MRTNLRGVVVGASTLLGKELIEELNTSETAWDLCLADTGESSGQLVAGGDEALVVQPLSPGIFESRDVAFFAAEPQTTRSHWREAQTAGAAVIDLTTALESEPGAVVRSPWIPGSVIPPTNTAVVIPAHPAAIMLGIVASRLACCVQSSAPRGHRARTRVATGKQRTRRDASADSEPPRVPLTPAGGLRCSGRIQPADRPGWSSQSGHGRDRIHHPPPSQSNRRRIDRIFRDATTCAGACLSRLHYVRLRAALRKCRRHYSPARSPRRSRSSHESPRGSAQQSECCAGAGHSNRTHRRVPQS